MIKQRIEEEKKMREDQQQKLQSTIKNGEQTSKKRQFNRSLKKLRVTDENIKKLIKTKEYNNAKKSEIKFGEENKEQRI